MTHPMEEYYSEAAVRRRANRKVIVEGSIAVHGVVWLVGSALMGITGVPDFILYVVVWFGLVALHGTIIGLMQSREDTIRKEMEEAAKKRAELGLDEKAKRKNEDYSRDRLVLSEDGEVLDVVEDNWTEDNYKRDER